LLAAKIELLFVNPLLEYWNLVERPFEPVSPAKFYYHSGEHEEALARLNYLVDQETMYFGMLTGEIGCGKSLTRQIFASRINAEQHCLIHFENSVFPAPDLMRRLLGEFGWADVAAQAVDAHSLYVLITKLLRQLDCDYHRHLVLLFDEAQDMSRETLADLKRLSNLNDEGIGRLTIVLIGQPELRELVAQLPALDQRISLRFHLKPLGRDEIGSYVQHRLTVAGHPTADIFSTEADERLFEASRGFPREINRLAKLSLELARADSAREITARHVYRVVDDLRRHQSMPLLRGVQT